MPRPFEQSTRRRMRLDEHIDKFPLDKFGNEIMPFCVGSSVLCGNSSGGNLGEIASFDSGVLSTRPGYAGASGCTIIFQADGESVEVHYDSIGKAKGGANLRRVMPSLRPEQRNPPSFSYSEGLKERVSSTYHAECATSPCSKDERSKRVAPHLHMKVHPLVTSQPLSFTPPPNPPLCTLLASSPLFFPQF